MDDRMEMLAALNQILEDELKTINRIIVHSLKSDNKDYGVVYDEIKKEIGEELKQAELLVKRIVFLEMLKKRQNSRSIGHNESGISRSKKNFSV